MDTRVTPRSSIENNAASEGGDATANVPRRRAFWFPNTSLPRELDIFGFYLSIKHSLVALLLSIIMCGPFGTCIILAALGVYTMSQTRSFPNSSQRRTSNASRGSRWHGGSGANIRGVTDLPQDPKGG